MKYIYTAVFTPIENGQYAAAVPDLPGCITTGRDLGDAIAQITDAMNGWLVVAEDEGIPIAPPTPQAQLAHAEKDELAFVQADTIAYRALTDTRAVRKNVSLPAWMAAMADKRGLNCSQLLQDTLLRQLEAAPSAR